MLQSQLNWNLERALSRSVSFLAQQIEKAEDIYAFYFGQTAIVFELLLVDKNGLVIGAAPSAGLYFDYDLQYQVVKNNKSMFVFVGSYIDTVYKEDVNLVSYKDSILRDLDKVIPELVKYF